MKFPQHFLQVRGFMIGGDIALENLFDDALGSQVNLVKVK